MTLNECVSLRDYINFPINTGKSVLHSAFVSVTNILLVDSFSTLCESSGYLGELKTFNKSHLENGKDTSKSFLSKTFHTSILCFKITKRWEKTSKTEIRYFQALSALIVLKFSFRFNFLPRLFLFSFSVVQS